MAYLRDKWRIVGGLIGALPSQPRQNAQLGLPLKLMSEETTLLIEMGTYAKMKPSSFPLLGTSVSMYNILT